MFLAAQIKGSSACDPSVKHGLILIVIVIASVLPCSSYTSCSVLPSELILSTDSTHLWSICIIYNSTKSLPLLLPCYSINIPLVFCSLVLVVLCSPIRSVSSPVIFKCWGSVWSFSCRAHRRTVESMEAGCFSSTFASTHHQQPAAL